MLSMFFRSQQVSGQDKDIAVTSTKGSGSSTEPSVAYAKATGQGGEDSHPVVSVDKPGVEDKKFKSDIEVRSKSGDNSHTGGQKVSTPERDRDLERPNKQIEGDGGIRQPSHHHESKPSRVNPTLPNPSNIISHSAKPPSNVANVRSVAPPPRSNNHEQALKQGKAVAMGPSESGRSIIVDKAASQAGTVKCSTPRDSHPVVLEKPRVSVDKPSVLVDKPYVVVNKPSVLVDKPDILVNKPDDKPSVRSTLIERATGQTGEVVDSSSDIRSVICANPGGSHPVVLVDKPRVLMNKPSVSVNKPNIVVDKPNDKPSVRSILIEKDTGQTGEVVDSSLDIRSVICANPRGSHPVVLVDKPRVLVNKPNIVVDKPDVLVDKANDKPSVRSILIEKDTGQTGEVVDSLSDIRSVIFANPGGRHPVVLVDKPRVLVDKPSVSVNKPNIVVDKPDVLVDKPNDKPSMRSILIEKDTGQTGEVVDSLSDIRTVRCTNLGVSHPVFLVDKPDDKPSVLVNKPGVLVHKPDNKPNVLVDKPSVLVNKSGVLVHKPDNKPNVLVNQPSDLVDKPGVLVNTPGILIHKPSVLVHSSSVLVDKPNDKLGVDDRFKLDVGIPSKAGANFHTGVQRSPQGRILAPERDNGPERSTKQTEEAQGRSRKLSYRRHESKPPPILSNIKFNSTWQAKPPSNAVNDGSVASPSRSKSHGQVSNQNRAVPLSPSASGRSTSIDKAAGQATEVVDSLSDIRSVTCVDPGGSPAVVLVDKPNVDDTFKSNLEILSKSGTDFHKKVQKSPQIPRAPAPEQEREQEPPNKRTGKPAGKVRPSLHRRASKQSRVDPHTSDETSLSVPQAKVPSNVVNVSSMAQPPQPNKHGQVSKQDKAVIVGPSGYEKSAAIEQGADPAGKVVDSLSETRSVRCAHLGDSHPVGSVHTPGVDDTFKSDLEMLNKPVAKFNMEGQKSPQVPRATVPERERPQERSNQRTAGDERGIREPPHRPNEPKLFRADPVLLQSSGITPHSTLQAKPPSNAANLDSVAPFHRSNNNGWTSKQDRIIVVMGPTGSGKSTFIDKATGQCTQAVGHGLKSYTKNIRTVRTKHPVDGHPVLFVDTPGFGDTYRSDLEIFDMITNWLVTTYQQNNKLAGIIYLHRIFDNRMTGTALKSLRLFESICGLDAMSSVILVTTLWDEANETVAELREQQMKTSFWKDILENGGRTGRFDYTSKSAWNIIDRLSPNDQAPLQLVTDIVDRRLPFNQTKAGILLEQEHKQAIKDWENAERRLEDGSGSSRSATI